MPAELSVAQYLPKRGNVRHWALHLQMPSESRTYQVVGEPTEFEYGHRKNVDPTNSARFVESIFVSEVDLGDAVKSVKETLKKFPIRNDVSTWSCQDWVLEALEELKDEELIDESSYFSAQEQLLAQFN